MRVYMHACVTFSMNAQSIHAKMIADMRAHACAHCIFHEYVSARRQGEPEGAAAGVGPCRAITAAATPARLDVVRGLKEFQPQNHQLWARDKEVHARPEIADGPRREGILHDHARRRAAREQDAADGLVLDGLLPLHDHERLREAEKVEPRHASYDAVAAVAEAVADPRRPLSLLAIQRRRVVLDALIRRGRHGARRVHALVRRAARSLPAVHGAKRPWLPSPADTKNTSGRPSRRPPRVDVLREELPLHYFRGWKLIE